MKCYKIVIYGQSLVGAGKPEVGCVEELFADLGWSDDTILDILIEEVDVELKVIEKEKS
jgi:hypothetical protein